MYSLNFLFCLPGSYDMIRLPSAAITILSYLGHKAVIQLIFSSGSSPKERPYELNYQGARNRAAHKSVCALGATHRATEFNVSPLDSDFALVPALLHF